ncbi:MAG: hypothetical protein MRERV_1c007 [Mycoplasmataceae bacterium RV_VA103A]|nr:MAG: hypothetical protein MRERV_1c007 [Mycoplasmataceae bacterium RV_VA103A]
MDWKSLLQENWLLIVVLVILLFLLLVFFVSWEKAEIKKKRDRHFLICPIRGPLRVQKYDTKGHYTEEYQRIRLIKYLLQKGYPKNQFIIEYAIPIGHKGHNTLRVDLVIKEQKKFICVAEVKKGYTKENMRSAIKHQLVPAMRIVNAKYGVYFDGTKKSRLLSRNNDGTLSIREFP